MDADTQKTYDDLKALFAAFHEVIVKLEKDGRILRKNKELSIEVCEEANDLLNKKEHDSKVHSEILSQYTRSIALARVGKEELAIGYSNRSIMLMHLYRYKESVVDIDRAFKISKNGALKKKLAIRKEKCFALINNEKLTKATENVTLHDKNKDLEDLAAKLQNFNPSSTLPCASDCVSLACNDTFGRHLVANRDIEPGEVLIVEQAQVCYPTLDQTYLVCSHCLQIAWNGIPCNKCVFTIYCSETCKNEAWAEYHDVECSMVKYMDSTVFNSEKTGYYRMATIRLLIRALKREGYENLMREVFEKENERNLEALLTDGILQSDKLKSFYNLLSHEKDFETEIENYELHTSQIVYLLIEHTDFLASFIKKNALGSTKLDLSNTSQEDKNTVNPRVLLKLKEVLTKLKYITLANGCLFQTTPYQCGCKNLDECHKTCSSTRGIVIVPCFSLLNHSCAPNVSHTFSPKRKIIVYSISPIKKGEQLFDNYGASLLSDDLKTRESRLKELHFDCKCKACSDKIEISMIPDITKDEHLKILMEFQESFPTEIRNSFFVNSIENCEMSEEVLQYVVKMTQLYHKYFNYYEARKHSYKCLAYFEKMMSTLYEEKSAIPNEC